MAIIVPSVASETTVYTYDALGRLVTTTVAGGPAGGTQTGTTFDPAGNRSTYTVSGVPGAPAFSINSVSATEGSALVFTITKTGTATGSLSVNYATSNGTATSPSDYTSTSGTLTFLAGETSKTVSVPTIDDTSVEGSETVIMTLSGASAGATIATAVGTGTIIDNDVAPPSFAIGNAAAVTEGGMLTFTVTKTGAATSSYSVNYASASGTATSGTDFTPVSGTLTFLAGETTKTISVVTIDDNEVESSETVLMNLSSPTGGATITTAQGTGTINDNDVAPSFAIGNAPAVTEGGTLVFTVTKTGATNTSYSVNYASASGTATSGTDFTPVSGTLTFLAGETTKTINVVTIDDVVVESAETVLMNLSAPTGGATITTAQGMGTINDNDLPPPSFAIANAVAVAEGGTLAFTVTKTGATNTSYSVNYASASGTATSGTDFTPVSGTLTFLAGETTKTIYVATIDDTAVEPDETVLVNLSSPTGGATITTAQGSGTILNNDTASVPAPTPLNPSLSVYSESTTTITLATLANSTGPAAIISFSPPSGGGSATVASGGQSVSYIAPFLAQPGMCQPAYSYTYTIAYTVQNSPGGASASGAATITVTSPAGDQPGPWEGCP